MRPSLAKFLKVDTTKKAAALHHPKVKIKIPFKSDQYLLDSYPRSALTHTI